jgi:ABC-type molybdate transport system substrate-binding protein
VLKRSSILAAFAAAIVLAATPYPARAQDQSITVFAAASMKNALDDVDAAFTKKSGVKVVASYDASSALMKQIEGGAPADVFVSADLKWMDYGAQKKLIKDDSRVNLLGNELVLVAGKDSKIGTVTIRPGFDLAGLAGDGRIATGDVKAVPVGIYAQAALQKLGVWVVGRAKDGDGRERPRRSYPGLAWRSAARHRLRDRRQSRTWCEGRRRVSGRLPRSDHLPGCGNDGRQAGRGTVSRVPSLASGEVDLRELRLFGFAKADIVTMDWPVVAGLDPAFHRRGAVWMRGSSPRMTSR